MWRQCLLSTFLRYCCSDVGWYYEPHSRLQGAKGLCFQWKTKKMFNFCWNCLKRDCLTSLRGFERFLIFLILFNSFSPGKWKNWIFEIPVTPQTLNTYNWRTKRQSLPTWLSLVLHRPQLRYKISGILVENQSVKTHRSTIQ